MILCRDSLILIVSHLRLTPHVADAMHLVDQMLQNQYGRALRRRSTVYSCGKFNTSCPSTIGTNWNSRCDNRDVVSMVISARNPSKPNPKHPACSKVWRSIPLGLHWRTKTVYIKGGRRAQTSPPPFDGRRIR